MSKPTPYKIKPSFGTLPRVLFIYLLFIIKVITLCFRDIQISFPLFNQMAIYPFFYASFVLVIFCLDRRDLNTLLSKLHLSVSII